jgi:hypothetical protein
MTRLSRAITIAAITMWVITLGWPVAGVLNHRLTPDAVPGLHMGLLILAATLTVSTLVPRLAASHLACFAMGVMSMEDQRDGRDGPDGHPPDAKVVNLRPGGSRATK